MADVVTVPETANTPSMTVPAKGSSMSEVVKKFGEPRNKRPTVGGDTPKHPPITRWDYDNFVVIFEKDRVVDAVVPGAPPRLRTTAGLSPATNAPPAPAMPAPEAVPPDMPPPPAEPEPVIPEAPKEEAAPPMEPTAEAPPPAAEPAPPPVEQPAPAAERPAQQMQPAPVQSPVPADEYGEGPPTPK